MKKNQNKAQFINENTSISYQDNINVLHQLYNDSSIMIQRSVVEGVLALLSLRNKIFEKYENFLILSSANQVLPFILASELTCSSKVISLHYITGLELV